MRILYGVFGYGRGHATRALSLLPELRRRHEVVVVAGGDAFDAIVPDHPVEQIPTLRYEYGSEGTRSLSRTLSENLAHVSDILLRGPGYTKVARVIRDHRPDVAICDAEPWTHAAAAAHRIPRVSLDHFGVLAYCRPPIAWTDRLRSLRDVLAYRALMGRPNRVIVSSFYDGGARNPRIRFVGPLLRPEVLARAPSRGDSLLVYLNRGQHQLTPSIEAALTALPLPVVVYGTARHGTARNLTFRPPSNGPFLDDLASCRAVFSTAGNQLVGEALWFGKPMLVMPEHTVEQRLNAAAVERLGIGRKVHPAGVTTRFIERFLADEGDFRGAMRSAVRDGRAEALSAIEGFGREVMARSRSRTRAWGFA
ncbi:MAG TPA: glycosyltransferase family protein [Polyangiaceae bacterium]|jgi:uncharacterized protein (TIGR00661 family)